MVAEHDGDRERIEALLGTAILEMEALAGLTNRNFRVRTADELLAVRLPGAGSEAFVDREAERHNARRAATIGVNCEISSIEDDGAMVCHFVEGEVLTAERLRDD